MKKRDAAATALEAVSRLLADPAPRVLHGTKSNPGVFASGGKTEKDAAKICIDRGWLEGTGEHLGKKEKYRITRGGIQAALNQADPSDLLRSLATGFEAVGPRLEETEKLVARRLGEILEQLGTLKAGLGASQQAIRQLETRLRPPDLEAILRKLQAAPSAGHPIAARLGWLQEVVRLVQEQRAKNAFQRLTLPQLFAQLLKQQPSLTLDQFHEGLRQLHETGAIRLGPYTQALATLDDPRNALYLDREVKFYVEPR